MVLSCSSRDFHQRSVFVFCLSGAVLGLAANFATLFLPSINRELIFIFLVPLNLFIPPDDFTIFSLVVPSMTLFAFLLL